MALLNGTESIEQVEQVICDFFGVNIDDVYNKNRKSAVALARHFLLFILNTHYSCSQTSLSKRYNRNLFVVHHSVKQTKYYIEHDKQYIGYYSLLIN